MTFIPHTSPVVNAGQCQKMNCEKNDEKILSKFLHISHDAQRSRSLSAGTKWRPGIKEERLMIILSILGVWTAFSCQKCFALVVKVYIYPEYFLFLKERGCFWSKLRCYFHMGLI